MLKFILQVNITLQRCIYRIISSTDTVHLIFYVKKAEELKTKFLLMEVGSNIYGRYLTPALS